MLARTSTAPRAGRSWWRGRRQGLSPVPGARVEPVEPRRLLAAVSVSNAVVMEGDGGAGATSAVFTVTLTDPPAGQPVTVNYATFVGTASAGADFAPASGTVTFTPGGPTTQNITVGVNGDTLQEDTESFAVTLSSPTNATIVGPSGTGYILDDDESFLSTHHVNVAEGDGGITNAVFTVVRSGSTDGTSTVRYQTNPGSATTPADFTSIGGTLTFGPGVTSQAVTVPVVGDALREAAETFTLSFTNPTNTTLVTSNVTGTIVDNDSSTVAIDSVAVVEPGAGTINAVLTVTRHGSLAGAASVNYTTTNGTATAGTDFTATTGTLNFAAGEATQQIAVPVVSDTLQEDAERFYVDLSAPPAGNTTVGVSRGEVWIPANPSANSSLFVNDINLTEGTGTTGPSATFTVTRFGPTGAPATVNYATAGLTPGTDYTPVSGTLTFAPGETTKTVTVPVIADSITEPVETFFLDLSSPTNASLIRTRGNASLVDDDQSFVGVTGVTVVEGDAGTQNALVTLTRFGSSAGAANVQVNTNASTASTPADFIDSDTLVNFAPGETSRTLAVPVVNDTLQENFEQFGVSFSVPSGGNTVAVGQNATVYIIDEDASYLAIDNAVLLEGTADSPTNAVFTVTRYGALEGETTVNFTTANGTAQQPGDYTTTSGTVTFAPGASTATIAVPVAADGALENDETFNVNLSGAANGTVLDNQGQAVILDDDRAPAVTFVYVNGTSWTQAFRDELVEEGLGDPDLGFLVPGGPGQLAALPWSGINKIALRFSSDVLVQEGDLELRGGAGIAYGFAPGTFTYNAGRFVATWTLNKPLADFSTTNRQTEDRVRLDLNGTGPDGVRGTGPGGEFLDGEWADGTDAYPSGNGSPGGDFRFLINVVPGDANRNGNVSPTDYGTVRSGIGRNTTTEEGVAPNHYTVFKDVNANGNVSPTDIGVVRGNTGANITTVPTPAALGGTLSIAEELFGTSRIL